MKAFWLRTSSGIGLLFVALGVLLADREDDISDTVLTMRSGPGR